METGTKQHQLRGSHHPSGLVKYSRIRAHSCKAPPPNVPHPAFSHSVAPKSHEGGSCSARPPIFELRTPFARPVPAYYSPCAGGYTRLFSGASKRGAQSVRHHRGARRNPVVVPVVPHRACATRCHSSAIVLDRAGSHQNAMGGGREAPLSTINPQLSTFLNDISSHQDTMILYLQPFSPSAIFEPTNQADEQYN